jgi:hypothetical protein
VQVRGWRVVNERLAVGAASLAGGLSGLTAVARAMLPRPSGRHRAPQRAPFALAPQEFRLCLKCGVETAATVFPNGAFSCTEGHLYVPGGGGR